MAISFLGTNGYEHITRLSSQEAPRESALCLAARILAKTRLCYLFKHAPFIYLFAPHTQPIPYSIVMVPSYKSVIAANIEFRLETQGSKGKRTRGQVAENKQHKQEKAFNSDNGEREAG